MTRLIVLVLLAACDPYAVFTDGEFGRVYECQATRTDVLELCTDLDERELEKATGWSCEPTSRAWPRVVGCIYGCYPHQGCNAHHGCFCPEGSR